MNRFTPEDLLEYHYGEMGRERASGLRQALKESWPLKEKMQVIQEASERLDKSMVAPREASVQAIMEYAASHTSATI